MKSTLNENLELRKALTEVDRLTSENVNKQNLNIKLGGLLDSYARTVKDLKKENSELKDKLNKK